VRRFIRRWWFRIFEREGWLEHEEPPWRRDPGGFYVGDPLSALAELEGRGWL
jgi:hypothetical protein